MHTFIVKMHFWIDRNFCSVHEEITLIRLYTPGFTQGCVQPDWGYFEWIYTCFDCFKKSRLFVSERYLIIDVVLKASRAVVISWFSLDEAPLELFRFTSDYLPYFERPTCLHVFLQNNTIFNIIAWYKNGVNHICIPSLSRCISGLIAIFVRFMKK
jgi:hypothetical protein